MENKKEVIRKNILKVNEKMIQKAYFLNPYFKEEIQDQENHKDSMNLPDDFYKVLGKVLLFVEKVDQE